MRCIFFCNDNTLPSISCTKRLTLHIIISRDIHTVTCVQNNIKELSLLCINILVLIIVEEVQGTLITKMGECSNVDVLTEDRRDKTESFLAFDNADVLLVDYLLWTALEISPVGE